MTLRRRIIRRSGFFTIVFRGDQNMFLALTMNQNKLITNLCDGQTVPDSQEARQALNLLGLSAQVVTSKGSLHLVKKIELIDAAQVQGT